MNDYTPNFGLHHDINWRLIPFIDKDLLSRMPLCDFQIDYLANSNYLNWDIISNRPLPDYILLNHKEKINWSIYLRNFDVDIKLLRQVRKYLYYDIFADRQTKRYYNNQFILSFPHLVDWKWCIKNIQLSNYILTTFRDKFKPSHIKKYQFKRASNRSGP